MRILDAQPKAHVLGTQRAALVRRSGVISDIPRHREGADLCHSQIGGI